MSRYWGGPYPRRKRLILDHFSAARTRRSRVPVRTKNSSEISRRSFQRASARLAIRVSVCARFRVLGPEMPKKHKQRKQATSKHATSNNKQASKHNGISPDGLNQKNRGPHAGQARLDHHHHQPLRIFGSVWRLFLLISSYFPVRDLNEHRT